MGTDKRQGICPLPEYDGREPFAETFMALADVNSTSSSSTFFPLGTSSWMAT